MMHRRNFLQALAALLPASLARKALRRYGFPEDTREPRG